VAGSCTRIKPLVAARPGYIRPPLLAKMIATFDQLTGGRIYVNLIAGASDEEIRADGIPWSKEERYAVMDEEVTLLKRLWTEEGKVDFAGRYHRCEGARILPRCHQQPHPPFYLGGGSRQAWDISAKHAHVHLFWGDTPERIGETIDQIRELAAGCRREHELGFGMRLQIVCRETEEAAWHAADHLIAGASDTWKAMIQRIWSASEANRRMKELSRAPDLKIGPHLWTGITTVRPGAGVAVVGNPEQVAETLQRFIDIGCHSFCLSGYPHDEEAERFGAEVMPLLRRANPARMPLAV